MIKFGTAARRTSQGINRVASNAVGSDLSGSGVVRAAFRAGVGRVYGRATRRSNDVDRSASGTRTTGRAEDEWGLLMKAAQNGNGESYLRLLDELSGWLTRFYLRRLPPALVEGTVRGALITVHDKRHTYDPRRPFKPWLVALARYKWIDCLRRMHRSGNRSTSDGLGIGNHESGPAGAVVLGRLLGKLKPAQAAVIRLVKLQGFSIEETSIRTGQSRLLVKLNMYRGLKHLVRLVEK